MSTPSFAGYFRDVHGVSPFPWQERLVDEVLGRGWPALLDVPTGAGKTSAIDVALFALAVAPERMPRRMVLVVDRRIVVDQGADHARAIRTALAEPRGGDAAEVAQRLRALWTADAKAPPFAVAVLRGGMPRDDDWAKRPDQPVVGVSTVDQVGSRLLFRGYGVGSRAAPIHAGLFGNDTLILLDEVHLSVPFAETLRAIRARYRKHVAGLPARFAVVEMSATPLRTAHDDVVFGLRDEDRAHPVLAQRLGAKKPATLVEVKVRGDDEQEKRQAVAREAVKAAIALQQKGAQVVGLVVNRVDTARIAWKLLAEHDSTDRLLVTGRMRPIDRDNLVRRSLLPRAGAGRPREPGRPIVVVATQCIEAGADLDFDGLVTECASLDALRQRFGRLDRRGEVTATMGQAAAVILCRSDQAKEDGDDPVYGPALGATWRWLKGVAGSGGVDLGISSSAVPSPLPEGTIPRPLSAPVLLPAHLDAWAQTSPILRPAPDPDIALWLHGPERATAEVQLVWRADVVAPDEERSLDDEKLELDDDERELLSLVRPSTLEALSVPLHAARAWLDGRSDDIGVGDTLGEQLEEAEEADAAQGRLAIAWNRERPRWCRSGDMRPGDVVVVPASYGGLNEAMTFDPEERSPVLDIGDLAQLRARALASVRMSAPTLAQWGIDREIIEKLPFPKDEETAAELKAHIADWGALWPSVPPPGFRGRAEEWSSVVDALTHPLRRPAVVSGAEASSCVLVQRARKLVDPDAEGEALTEDDASSFTSNAVTLERHSGDVRDFAEVFARRTGFGPEIVRDLALAGWLHDVGKADPRFQRWLVGGSEVKALMLKDPLAKSELPSGNAAEREQARKKAGYPSGYRHELLSLALVKDHPEILAQAHDADLVLHLVASHHGWCRPFPPALDHARDDRAELTHGGVSLAAPTRHQLARLDSGVADRFWRLIDKYGWWGLAWMEAVLRLADHRASEEEVG